MLTSQYQLNHRIYEYFSVIFVLAACELHVAPYACDCITYLCRQQADVVRNKESTFCHNMGQGKVKHRQKKKITLALGGVEATTVQVIKLSL